MPARTTPAMIGNFFIDRLNPSTPCTIKITGILTDGVYICEYWGMNEHGGEWRFEVFPNDRGWQVAARSFDRMEQVSLDAAREDNEQRLRQSDKSWRGQYAPDRAPVTILR